MASDWRLSTWGEEISLEYGKALRGYQEGESGYRVFGSNGPIGWTDKFLAKGPGVILGRKGAYRGVHFSKDPFFVIDTAYYVEPKSEMDMRWLYYAIQHYKLGEIDDGSPIPSTTRAAVYVRDLEVPPLEQQREIGRVLAVLDDRIDHNRALAANLEAIARALFNSWFVDFDPVRAKAAGETPPGLASDLAALFPDRFVDSELGEVPEGWANKAIGDVLAVLETGRRPKGGVKGIREGVPSVGAESINGIGQFDFSQTKYVPREFFDKLKTGKPQSFDTLLYKDGGKPGDFRPRIGMYGCGFPFDEYALNEHVFMLRADAARVGSFYLYFWMARDETMHILQNAGGKAAIPGINRQDVMTLPVQLPPMKLVGAFERIVAPMVERILTAQKESQRMAQLRDLLLPRLISGKLRVEDAEAALEAA